MKCPKCGYNQKVKDGMTCGQCHYSFSFNPKETGSLKLTDGKFSACIQSASQNGARWFTKNQLYAVFCRSMKGSSTAGIIFGIVMIVVGIIVSFKAFWPFGLGLLVFGSIVALISHFSVQQKIEPAQFHRYLAKWKTDGKSVDHLLEEPSLHEPPPDWTEPDIYDYGVERILIVEREILVDLFVKNGIHAEQRMLVISESGYPSYLVPVAQKLIEERSDLPVYLLHDATSHGSAMAKRIQAGNLLPLGEHPVTDLGLFSSDFKNLKRTKLFNVDNEARALPVDALMLPFLTMGMGAAFTQGVPFSTLLEEEKRKSMSDGGSDFG